MFLKYNDLTKEQKKGIISHTITTLLIVPILVIINWLTPVEYFWSKWPALGMTIGLFIHILVLKFETKQKEI
jgi:hypothetical protein